MVLKMSPISNGEKKLLIVPADKFEQYLTKLKAKGYYPFFVALASNRNQKIVEIYRRGFQRKRLVDTDAGVDKGAK